MRGPRVVIAVPIKSFSESKSRLRAARPQLDVDQLTRRLAVGVIRASQPRDCVIICDDDDVARLATESGAEPLRIATQSLNSDVSAAYRELSGSYDTVIIAHGDLAVPDGLGGFESKADVTVVTDRHGSGTNVLSLVSGLQFEFAYGTNSASKHIRAAELLGVSVSIINDSPWGLDIDGPEDLELAPDAIRGGP
jgi:2-phospho-L-lactate guanylyltransferase